MRILLLTQVFNGLAQRLYVELAGRGHTVSVEFDIHEDVTREAVDLFRPDLLIAPYLKRAIPGDVWRRLPCLVVHPGIRGDRGPSALDWAILGHESDWGVTLLQANAEMDAGDVWATASFPMRVAAKSSLYRREVTEAAARCVLEALDRAADPAFRPQAVDPADPTLRGRARPLVRKADRAIDWSADDSGTVLAKIHSADGFPGVPDEVAGLACRLFGAWPEPAPPARGAPGAVLATRDGAILRATRDGAVWISHLRAEGAEGAIKLPATRVLGERLPPVPEWPMALDAPLATGGFRELAYSEQGRVGFLSFDFHNGAIVVPVAVGLFGVSEILLAASRAEKVEVQRPRMRDLVPTPAELKASAGPVLRGTFLGFLIGIIPGSAHIISSFVFYGIERRVSAHPERFGQGRGRGRRGARVGQQRLGERGVRAHAGPRRAFWADPGRHARRDHGPRRDPGPRAHLAAARALLGLHRHHGRGQRCATAAQPAAGGPVREPAAHPVSYLYPLLLAFCVMGVFSLNQSAVDLWIMIAAGLGGYLLRKFDFEPAPIVLGMILAPLLELSFRQSLEMSAGDYAIFFERPLALGMLILAAVLLLLALRPLFFRGRDWRARVGLDEAGGPS